MRNRIGRWIDVALLLILLVGLFYSSSQPYEKQDIRRPLSQHLNKERVEEKLGGITFHYAGKEISLNSVGVAGFVEFIIRKSTHFLTFAALTLMFYRVFRSRFSPAISFPWSGLLAVLTAILDEWHQTFTPNRTGMVTDVLLDTTGVSMMLLMIAAWLVFFRKKTKRSHKNVNRIGSPAYRK